MNVRQLWRDVQLLRLQLFFIGCRLRAMRRKTIPIYNAQHFRNTSVIVLLDIATLHISTCFALLIDRFQQENRKSQPPRISWQICRPPSSHCTIFAPHSVSNYLSSLTDRSHPLPPPTHPEEEEVKLSTPPPPHSATRRPLSQVRQVCSRALCPSPISPSRCRRCHRRSL